MFVNTEEVHLVQKARELSEELRVLGEVHIWLPVLPTEKHGLWMD